MIPTPQHPEELAALVCVLPDDVLRAAAARAEAAGDHEAAAYLRAALARRA